MNYAAAARTMGRNNSSAKTYGAHALRNPPRSAQAPSLNRVVTVSVSGMIEPDSMHLPDRFRIRLTGKGAAIFNPIQLGGFLLSVGAIKSSRCWEEAQYYQLCNPYERFVSFQPNDPDVNFQHGNEYACTFDERDPDSIGRVRIEDCRIKETHVTISFVAPSAEHDYVEEALRLAKMQPIGLKRSRFRQDQWHFRTVLQREHIPHYLIIPMKSFCQEILVTIPGRWTECLHCATTEHRTNQCPREKETKRKEYQERQRKREQKAAETAEKVEEARKAFDLKKKIQDEEQDEEVRKCKEEENKRLEERWTLVEDKKKRKNRKTSTPKAGEEEVGAQRLAAEELSSSPVPVPKRQALSLTDFPLLRKEDESHSTSLKWDSKYLDLATTPFQAKKRLKKTPTVLDSESRVVYHTPATSNVAKNLFQWHSSSDDDEHDVNSTSDLFTGSTGGSFCKNVPKVKVERPEDPVLQNAIIEGELSPSKFPPSSLNDSPRVGSAMHSPTDDRVGAPDDCKPSTLEGSSDDGGALVIVEDCESGSQHGELSANEETNKIKPLDFESTQSTHGGVSSN